MANTPWYRMKTGQPFKWSYNNPKAHSGIDIPMPVGTPITSPVNGVAVGDVGYHDWGGQVDIKFNSGGQTQVFTGLHFSQIASNVKPNGVVKAGDIIGWSGGVNSGPHPTKPQFSGGAHFHMELSSGGIAPYTTYNPRNPTSTSHPIDPTPFLGALVKYGISNDQTQYLAGDNSLDPQAQTVTADTTKQGFLSALADQVSQGSQAHQLLTEIPGFYGICVALDKAEQFSIYSPGWNPLDAPGYTIQWMIKNTIAFTFRAVLIILGIVLLIALFAALVHMNRWISQAGSLALPLALGAV